MATKVEAPPPPTPLRVGPLTLLAGIFRIPSKRVVTLWADRIEFPLQSPGINSGSTCVRVLDAHVTSDGDNKFILRDSATRVDHTFIAADATEKRAWLSAVESAVRTRHALRQAVLDKEKARADAIAARLGVFDVVVGKRVSTALPPPVDRKDMEAAAASAAIPTAAAADEHEGGSYRTAEVVKQEEPEAAETTTPDHRDDAPAKPQEYSQDVLNAAAACGVLTSQLDHRTAATGGTGSGVGHVRLVDDVYWYEVQPTDTLAGVCLRFDAQESVVRRTNNLTKANINGACL
jgi:hypothetical protein